MGLNSELKWSIDGVVVGGFELALSFDIGEFCPLVIDLRLILNRSDLTMLLDDLGVVNVESIR